MEPDPTDSIDDIISVLNAKKEDGRNMSFSNLNMSTDFDISEIGDILNDKDNRNYKDLGLFNHVDTLQNKINTLYFDKAPKMRTKIQEPEIKKLGEVLEMQDGKKVSEISKQINKEQNMTLHPRLLLSSGNNALAKLRYMRFKPYYGDLAVKNTEKIDRGYYFKFINANITIIRTVLEENGFMEHDKGFDFSILWCIGPIKSDIYQCLSFYQKVNHFPKSHEITRKDSMHRNISRMQIAHGLKNFNFIPKTFILPAETSLLKEDFDRHKGTKSYIVKPNGDSQGRGIFITDDLNEILPKQNQAIVVSHYVDDPYLIEGYKFDLRIYVAITSIHPLRIYMYEEGLVRFATNKYSKEKITKGNRFMHLTNYSINKHADGMVFQDVDSEDQASCKWNFLAFKKYFREHNIDVDTLFSRIEDLMVKTIISVEGIIFNAMTMQAPHRTNCFELLGFDILLDSQLRPWLLEVNLSPSLACETPLDQRIKSDLVADLFTLIGIVPNDQRAYQEPTFSKNYNMYSHGVQPTQVDKRSATNVYSMPKRLDELTKEEKQIVKETNDEYDRRGKFKRIYPNQNLIEYRMFFGGERPYNDLLRALIKENLKNNVSKGPLNTSLNNSRYSKGPGTSGFFS